MLRERERERSCIVKGKKTLMVLSSFLFSFLHLLSLSPPSSLFLSLSPSLSLYFIGKAHKAK